MYKCSQETTMLNYLAAPLFLRMEHLFNEDQTQRLEAQRFTTFFPQARWRGRG